MNWDETFTINLARPTITLMQVIQSSLTADYTPPIYYILAHLSMVLFGDNATAIRLPSAIAGVLLIPVMYFIGKEYKDELFGLLLAGFTTIFYNAYFYSKYGRTYSVDLFFFSLVFYFFMRLINGDKRAAIYFGIFSVLSVWTHMYSVIPIGIMILYLLWERKGYLGIAATIVGSIPLAYFYVPLILTTRISGVGSDTFGATPWEILLLTPVDIFGYSVFAIFPIVIWSLWKHRNEKILRVVSVISLVTWASMFVLSLRTPIILHYAIFLVPMLLMAGMIPIWEQMKEKRWLLRYIFAVIMILVMEIYQIFLLNFIQRGSW
jgi:uncharacterized membrane protein